ncbi:N-acetylglucosaminyldiphosphodolichol N-acetylglucosaminyltransferase catalytic subunit alg13 [Coemansia thaxteri]|uniref:UDP-N-acetylglucosamine transferase subunit ALG13 n=1 Tax=Coemansia thaxteri TaxID=2663907 RepID=A0A9W8EHT6_9FUNG|nr:N-acetylglucosaminyldiphosphodolichol N-acetylglucosaminyltransferase catalytic subunit alg13 [Coemansia thaxteri]KAJ2487284.1 N-acetylglucosaminyldiphosphodolichol N-acetylglucosaminyltransferase catalytic subunit alg13 [Coemansia sp. RSA 2320]
MSVYVTVGTTGFDELIRTVSTRAFLQCLAARGFRRLCVQYGTSEEEFAQPRTESDAFGIAIESFDYTSHPQNYVEQADLVICHAGTGSILEALHSRKPTIVVVNRGLMDNHQCEIAQELARRGYLVAAEPCGLAEAISSGEYARLEPYPNANPQPIGEMLDEETTPL